jgi:hypothetical protein
MKILIATPTHKLKLRDARKFHCAGLKFYDISPIKKYIQKDGRDLMYFVYKSDELDHKKLKHLVDHWTKHNSHRTLRFGENEMLKDVKGFYKNVKSEAKLLILLDSLMIFYTILKFGKCL